MADHSATATVAPRPSQTKIVATLGPASDKPEILVELIRAGVDVFRLNMAHGSQESHKATLDRIRAAVEEIDSPVAVLADLAGPKMRLGTLPGDRLSLDADSLVRLVRGSESYINDEAIPCLTTTYDLLIDELRPGNRVLLVDGTVSIEVEEITTEYAQCRVIQPGEIRSRQGVNLPGVELSVRALEPIDRDNAAWAARNGIDFVGLSFVRRPDEIVELQDILRENGSTAGVIAKIEKPEALENIEQIVQVADGVMVARGDLGVEIDIAQVVVAQKQIINVCHRHHKPVICATQMLDSMQQSRLPTRAEVADVSNAILDGADACMLSGETAIGRHPVEAVAMMHRIAIAAEPLCRNRLLPGNHNCTTVGVNETTEAVAEAASHLAARVDAKLIIVSSRSGATALALAKNRNYMPTIGVSDNEETIRRMCLYWGVIPLRTAPTESPSALLSHVEQLGRRRGSLIPGDRIVLITGFGMAPDLSPTSHHNTITVHEIQ